MRSLFFSFQRLLAFFLICMIPFSLLHSASLPSLPFLPAEGPISIYIQRLFNEDHVLSFDAILELIDQIESGDLDNVCSEMDRIQIGQFFAYLARAGLDSNTSEEEKSALERDIQEMIEPLNSSLSSDFLVLSIPAICTCSPQILSCKNWFSKQWNHIHDFVREHKKAVIIGTVFVVAAIAVVATVAITTSAAAAATAAATSAHHSHHVERQINELKTTAEQIHLISNTQEEALRLDGSLLAHETIAPSPLTDHGTIDSAFATNQSMNYLTESFSFPNSFDHMQTNCFLAKANQACLQQDYETAVDHFNCALEKDPNNGDIYLERAYAFMQMEDYDRSMSDYRTYTTFPSFSAPSSPDFNPIDFGIGFAKMLSKGALESGRNLAYFASEMVVHPIDTTCSICHAFSTLAQLTTSQEWKALSQAVAPEVCELIEIWPTLTSREQGERAGYILGKYGGDILLPGATAKVLTKGVQGAKQIILSAKNLKTADQVIALETLSQAMKEGGLVSDILPPPATGTRPWTEVKNLEFPTKKEQILRENGLWESFQKFKRAEHFLEPYQGQYLPESRIRELIHETGIHTFPRPKGIPENFRVMVSEKGAGMKYVHPKNQGTSIRAMPGKPHSPNSLQQKPYVVNMKNGCYLDESGSRVSPKSDKIHIPMKNFIYKE